MLKERRVYRSTSAHTDATPDLVVVGVASRDMTPDDPRGWRLGGSATYCALTAARMGLRVGCLIGVDAEAALADELLSLEAAGVALERFGLARGPVFENLESDGHRRQRWLSRSDAIPAAALPDAWRRAPGWLLVPVAGEIGPDWAVVPSAGAAVGVGWQGLVREFTDDGWVNRVDPGKSPLLEVASLVVASLDDLRGGIALSWAASLASAAAIVLTAGKGGGLALRDGKLSRYRAAAAPNPVDPTGAGDVFLAALMSAWLLTGELATAGGLRFAAAAASCVVEGVGLSGVPTAVEVAARARSADRASADSRA